MSRNFVQELHIRIKAGYSLIAVNTAEESRCIADITRAGWLMADGRRILLKREQQEAINAALQAIGLPVLSIHGRDGAIIRTADMIRAYDHAFSVGHAHWFESLAAALDVAGYSVHSWDMVDGFGEKKCVGEPGEAFQYVANSKAEDKGGLPKTGLFVFKDTVPFLNAPDNPIWRRHLRNLYESNRLVNREIRRPIVLLQPDWVPHADIAHCISFIDFDLPDAVHLDREITFTEASLSGTTERPTCPPELRQDVVYALRGLTQSEAVNALSLGVVAHKGFSPNMLADIRRVKAQAMKSDDTLEYIDEEKLASADDIGGYENYKEYIAECRSCYSPEAAAAGLKRPKGVLLLGCPGSGKSVVALATAKMLKLPLINFDFSAVFGGIVGASESAMRRSLRRISAQGACVVRIDEADKAFSGMQQTSGDSGVGQRVFGRLLSWMANENEDAFIIMTMNRLDGVPIEMLRSGRLDATFYTDLPAPAERRQILEIHLRRNNIPLTSFSADQIQAVIDKTKDYVGSEIEQVAVKAARMSWAARKQILPTGAELLDAAKSINPVAVLDKEGITKILEFCEGRATPVSRSQMDFKSTAGRKKGSVIVGE